MALPKKQVRDVGPRSSLASPPRARARGKGEKALVPLANARRERFIEEYVKDGNGSAAAVRAGYSPTSAHVTASRLLSDDNVRQAVESARVGASHVAELTAIDVLGDR